VGVKPKILALAADATLGDSMQQARVRKLGLGLAEFLVKNRRWMLFRRVYLLRRRRLMRIHAGTR